MAVCKWLKVFYGHLAVVGISLFVLFLVFGNTLSCYFSFFSYAILYAFVAYNTFGLAKRWFLDERILPEGKAVFITGCDSGFGNQLAQKLDSMGFHVFASCLFPDGEGARELEQTCSCRLRVLNVDVRDDKSVEEAFSFVKQNLGTNELWAVVNNAGVLKSYILEFTTMEDFKQTLEVNTFGQVRVTKVFLPLLKISKGRVVNVNSLAARLPTFELAAYSISKAAALAYTRCLSQGLHLWGVRVISIEPVKFRTPMADLKKFSSAFDEGVEKASKDVLAEYGEQFIAGSKKMISYFTMDLPFERGPYVVVDDMVSAVTQKYPSNVYRPRHNMVSRAIWWFLENLPYEMLEKVLFLKWYVGFPVPKALKSKKS